MIKHIHTYMYIICHNTNVTKMHVFLLFQLIVYLIIIWETIGIPSTCFIRPSSSSSLQQQQEEEEQQQQQVATVHFTEISKLANLNQKKKQSTIHLLQKKNWKI